MKTARSERTGLRWWHALLFVVAFSAPSWSCCRRIGQPVPEHATRGRAHRRRSRRPVARARRAGRTRRRRRSRGRRLWLAARTAPCGEFMMALHFDGLASAVQLSLGGSRVRSATPRSRRRPRSPPALRNFVTGAPAERSYFALLHWTSAHGAPPAARSSCGRVRRLRRHCLAIITVSFRQRPARRPRSRSPRCAARCT
jgi:hypothetical protein